MNLWAITSYFNPAGYRQRLLNYLRFRSRLRAPLVTVELAADGAFELAPSDADLVVQVSDGDVMWQKERLLNVAMSRLPPECTAVAWFDCDVVLERHDWVQATEHALRQFPLVQLYRERFNLGRDVDVDDLPDPAPYAMGQSFVYRLTEGMPVSVVSRIGNVGTWNASLGLAWAGRRDLVARHGLYDAGIMGGGDRALAGAAFGEMRAIAEPWHADEVRVQHFRRWAEPFFHEVRARVTYLEGRLFHLWHGERADRGYLTRYRDFRPFGFDPDIDIRHSSEGAWRWNSDKPAMHDYVRAYFPSRREDG
jgi:hypothetical protein